MSYTYNSSNEVTSVQSSSWGTSKNYTYDLGGNRVGALDNSNSGTTFSYDSQSNRLINTTSVVDGVDGATQSVSYDAMGNIVQTNLDTVTYGAGGRLAKWVSGGVTTKMYYNSLGQRTKTVVLGGPHSGVFVEFYDPEGRLIGVYKDNGQGGYDVIEELIYLDDFRVVATVRPDSVLGMTDPKIYPILTDHLGVPRSILDRDTAQKVWEWKDYEAFGNQAPNEMLSGTRFVYDGRFPGQRFDESTGSLHNGFRTYNAKLGRYMQSDPLGLSAGWNTYAYVGNSTVEKMDPWGLKIKYKDKVSENAVNYLEKNSPTAALEIKKAKDSWFTLTIGSDVTKAPEYYKIRREITWDPTMYVCDVSTKDVVATPALQLFHEIRHFNQNQLGSFAIWTLKDALFSMYGDPSRQTNASEQDAVHEFEYPVARELGIKNPRDQHSYTGRYYLDRK